MQMALLDEFVVSKHMNSKTKFERGRGCWSSKVFGPRGNKPFATSATFLESPPPIPTELAKLDQGREGMVEGLARRLGFASAALCLMLDMPRRASSAQGRLSTVGGSLLDLCE